jgi:hypothetical protein
VVYGRCLILKTVGWAKDDLGDNSLSEALYLCDICGSFHYPEEADDLISMWSSPKKNEEGIRCIKWTPSGSLDRYLDEYKYLLNCWDEVILDNYLELFDNKFALIRNGKYRHHLIAGERKDDNDISLRIWTDKIFTREKEYKFNFRSDEELKKFLVDNQIVIDSCLSNDFFLYEKLYISACREQFDNQDLFYYRYGNYVEPFKETGDCDPYFGLL